MIICKNFDQLFQDGATFLSASDSPARAPSKTLQKNKKNNKKRTFIQPLVLEVPDKP